MSDDYLTLVDDWDVSEEGVLVETRIFSVRQRRCTSRVDSSKSGMFYYLDGTDWVNVLAVTPDRQVVMIEQYRHGLGEVTLEIPGGIVDPGEAPLDAGLRELAEETGFSGTESRIIVAVSPNPAIQTNRCHTVFVSECSKTQETQQDSAEEIETRLVSLDDVPGLIQRGVIHHALVVAAFHHHSLLR